MRSESPSAVRNREPIRGVLGPLLPDSGRVLEVPCGSGVHSAFFSAAFPALDWLPADVSPEAVASTREWRGEGGPLLRAAVHLDLTVLPWDLGQFDAIVAINLIHASPPEVMRGLFAGAETALVPGGLLYLYGPYREAGVTSPSNEAFEQNYLKQQSPLWGLRDLDDVVALASTHGLVLEKRVEMPANNLSVAFRRQTVPPTASLG